MARIDIDTLRRLEELSKIRCEVEEEEKFLKELEQIVQYVEQLNGIDTEEVEPLFYVIEGALSTPIREDVVVETITTEEFLENVPEGEKIAQLVKIPPTHETNREKA